ncbi:MAG: nickel insertion protein [Caldilineaceae bacterium]
MRRRCRNNSCAAGARWTIWLTPVQMKKGRPGTLVGVLAAPEDETTLTQILLRETTTLGGYLTCAGARPGAYGP